METLQNHQSDLVKFQEEIRKEFNEAKTYERNKSYEAKTHERIESYKAKQEAQYEYMKLKEHY